MWNFRTPSLNLQPTVGLHMSGFLIAGAEVLGEWTGSGYGREYLQCAFGAW